jgi:hypothetical protein
MCGDGDLVRQIPEEPPLAGCEAVLTGTWAEYQVADCLTTVDQQLAYRIPNRFAGDRHNRAGCTLSKLDGHVWQLQRLANCPHDCG